METFVGVGNIGFPSSRVLGINGNIAITAKLSREMRILSHENTRFHQLFLFCIGMTLEAFGAFEWKSREVLEYLSE